MKSTFHQNRKANPIVISKKVEKLSKQLDNLKNTLSAVNQANASHLAHLSNFARHDMGNAIQNLHATIKNIEDSVDRSIIEELKGSLSMLEATLENLGQMTHFANKDNFKIADLLSATVLLSRSRINKHGIKLKTTISPELQSVDIVQPFQGLLQMIHNIILNAINALSEIRSDKRIVIEANLENNRCVILIRNNGKLIPEEISKKIFDFGFTTTSGSGIGLAYARYLCEEINGDISLTEGDSQFPTVFKISFPICL